MTEQTANKGVDLSAAFDSTLGVFRKVEREDLGKPTPCASWDVRALINHCVAGGHWWAALVTGDKSLEAPEGHDFTTGDFVAAYEESIRLALDAFGAEGAAERIVKAPFGDLPGLALQGIAATDQFTHGWDLARALGGDTDLAPALAAELLGLAEVTIGDGLRGPDAQAPFAPACPAPEGATTADRLAAYLGRGV